MDASNSSASLITDLRQTIAAAQALLAEVDADARARGERMRACDEKLAAARAEITAAQQQHDRLSGMSALDFLLNAAGAKQ